MTHREIAVFLVVGTLVVLTDFSVYGFLAWVGLGINTAKAIGFVSGTGLAYFANRYWTFGHRNSAQGSFFRFALLYSVTLCVNVQVNALALAYLPPWSHNIQIAFLIATGTSATLNFLGMKFVVFRSAHELETI